MRVNASFILCGIILLLSSCKSQEDNKDYQIEKETRVVNLYGIGDTLKTQNEYYIVSNGKRSAVVVGYVCHTKDKVGLYVAPRRKHGNTFPVDDDMVIAMFTHVMDVVKAELLSVGSVEISMSACGISNLNICYWKTKTLDKKFLQQPLFKQMCDVLRKYGYEVCSFSNNDFYPITVRDMGKFHILPDSCSLNSIGINGIVTIKCRSIK